PAQQVTGLGAGGAVHDLAHVVGFPRSGPAGQQRLDAADVGRHGGQHVTGDLCEVDRLDLGVLGAGSAHPRAPGRGGQCRDRLGDRVWALLGRGHGVLVAGHGYPPLGRPWGSSRAPTDGNGLPPLYLASSRSTSAITASLMNCDSVRGPSVVMVCRIAPRTRPVSSGSW